MHLRERNYPPQYWLQLHTHMIDVSPSSPPKRPRAPPSKKFNDCLSFLSPHIQKFIYSAATDKRKGEIRSSRFPLSREQYTLLHQIGVS